MKNLIIFFPGDYNSDFGDDAFFGMPEFVKSGFLDFIGMFDDEKNIKIFICRGEGSYLGEGKFKYGFLFNKGDFSFFNEKIKAGLVFNRSSFLFENGFNDNKLIKFCKNKVNFITLFPHFSPKTFLINNAKELKNNLKSIPKNHKKVLKPIDGRYGDDVLISNKDRELLSYKKYPFLLQEFLDTSVGIPGVYEGIHDLRVVVINGKILWSMFRTPEQGSFVSNTHKGGEIHVLDLEKIPSEVFSIVEEIDGLLESVGDRYYSIDLGFTNNGIKVFELNSLPAIRNLEFGTRVLLEGLGKVVLERLKFLMMK